MSEIVYLDQTPLSEDEIVRYVRGSMPTTVGVQIGPDDKDSQGRDILTVILTYRPKAGPVTGSRWWFRRNIIVTKALLSDMVEGYLNHLARPAPPASPLN